MRLWVWFWKRFGWQSFPHSERFRNQIEKEIQSRIQNHILNMFLDAFCVWLAWILEGFWMVQAEFLCSGSLFWKLEHVRADLFEAGIFGHLSLRFIRLHHRGLLLFGEGVWALHAHIYVSDERDFLQPRRGRLGLAEALQGQQRARLRRARQADDHRYSEHGHRARDLLGERAAGQRQARNPIFTEWERFWKRFWICV